MCSPRHHQDLDHDDDDDDEDTYFIIFINPTVSPLSLIKLEQAWLDRLWFKEGR